MLLNVSYNDNTIREKIDTEVGKPFSLKERWSMGGIGSSKLFITHTSLNIHNLLVLDQNLKTCNVELRPQGIIVRFRSLLETYALVIPFYKLKIYKGKAEEYSIYKDESLIKILADTKAIHKFFSKINTLKAESRPPSVDEL
ncbi:MAG: hypothetical protein ACKVKK_02330 [Flavobacteriales bacterium]|jgi:hypothetical protein|tara:strand:+ start:28 stop:453 length:426 start_codon:yes stop_codon:yes gene_type:complete